MLIQRRTLNRRPDNHNDRIIDDKHGKQEKNVHSILRQDMERWTKLTNNEYKKTS